MNCAFQHGKILSGSLAPIVAPIISVLTAASASRKSRLTNPAFLIETVPRIEIVVTRSFKKRKHFLIETRILLGDGTVHNVRAAETAKINRKPESARLPVSQSKQRTIPRINWKPLIISRARRTGFSSHSPLGTRHCLFNRNIELIESPVSHSKQRTAHQINRNISRGSFARAVGFTNHYSPLTNHPLRPTRQSAKISRTMGQSLQCAVLARCSPSEA